MSLPDNYVAMDFPSLPENVNFARTTVALFASRLGFTIDEIDEIKVAVSEAVSNAVVHAYAPGNGQVRLRAAVEDGALTVCVEDDGRGIADIAWAEEAANTTAPEDHMGLGLVFMREYMDDVRVTSKSGKGTSVEMVKRPAAAAAAAHPGAGPGGPVRH